MSLLKKVYLRRGKEESLKRLVKIFLHSFLPEEHYPIAKPTVAQLIQLSLDEKNMSQKQLAEEIGVSQSRISDYISGRAEPTLKIARMLCATLGITPAAMLGC